MPTSVAISEKQRAKQIVGEIIHQMGGRLSSKLELARLYWRAHLLYAEYQPGYLSFWPLIKTAAGPKIQDADLLLGELVAEGVLRIDESCDGESHTLRLELSDNGTTREELTSDAVESIRRAFSRQDGLPNLDEFRSLRSWNEAGEGEELNIYLDVIPDAEYNQRKRELQDLALVMKDVCRESP